MRPIALIFSFLTISILVLSSNQEEVPAKSSPPETDDTEKASAKGNKAQPRSLGNAVDTLTVINEHVKCLAHENCKSAGHSMGKLLLAGLVSIRRFVDSYNLHDDAWILRVLLAANQLVEVALLNNMETR